MKRKQTHHAPTGPVSTSLPKTLTGIAGLDEITGGGLPTGRPTLVCGGAGSGKTLFAMEFLVRGATQFGEPGVFMSFEERAEELIANVASLGFNLPALIKRRKVVLQHVLIEREQIEEAGEYDLEGLFIRLGHAIDSVGAKRVVLDTIEALFAGLSNMAILRSELVRLFRWLKDRGVTTIITTERGDGALTRHGLEEYVSDCVILLDHRVHEQVSTRKLRIVKYRGSAHGTNEYPFLIDEKGFSVLPLTSLGLGHDCSAERISTGILRLDAMLGDKGFYRGSSILVSGTPGTGKTTIANQFIAAACGRGERGLSFAFEESPAQIHRNMKSVDIDLETHVRKGNLRYHASRPTLHGLEQHLVQMHRLFDEFKPTVVVVDPISNLQAAGTAADASAVLLRLIDFLKSRCVTALFTHLTPFGGTMERSESEISSLMDTWLFMRDLEINGERNRGLYVLKSRGMAHSNQIREFVLTANGIDLLDAYAGPGGVLTGSSRIAQEALDQIDAQSRAQDLERKQRNLEGKRRALEAQIVALRAGFENEGEELLHVIQESQADQRQGLETRRAMATSRKQDNGHPVAVGILAAAPTSPRRA
ncbi:MAG: circadian clock protein KaiC [Planctomycetota bacterium]|nr:circadian clock protein KaiC [Planctomycetota bacterium]